MLIKDAVFLTVDTETTGLDPATCGIVELAGVWSKTTGLALSWSTLCDPGMPIPPEASSIHHLRTEDVAGRISPREALAAMSGLTPFGAPTGCLVAHNMEFDWGMIKLQLDEPEAVYPNRLCTMRLAKKLWPLLPKLSNQFLRYHLKLDIPAGGNVHRASDDAMVTNLLLRAEIAELLSRSKDPDTATIEGLVAWVEAPMVLQTPIPFGKHKGLDWGSAPKDYFQWALKNMEDLDRDIRHTMEHHLGLRPVAIPVAVG